MFITDKEFDEECFNELFLKTLIIEWLDSIDIIINPYRCSDGLWDYEINNFDSNIANGLAFKTRTEATTQAITKSVEIFNKLNNGK